MVDPRCHVCDTPLRVAFYVEREDLEGPGENGLYRTTPRWGLVSLCPEDPHHNVARELLDRWVFIGGYGYRLNE